MRWFSFAILVLAAVLLHTICQPLGLGRQRLMPDLLLLLAIVLAFRGPGPQALLACWILGLTKDINSVAPLGSYAFCFGLLGLFIVWFRELIYGENSLLLMGLTFAGCCLVEHAFWAILTLKTDSASPRYLQMLPAVLLSAAFTAALAPYVNWLIVKLHRPLGLPSGRRYGR